MAEVRLHPAEADRLDSLHSYGILDTAPAAGYDDLAALAARLCDAQVGAVTFVDAERQWFKAVHGYAIDEVPRTLSFCSDAVAGTTVLVVPDLAQHPRYADNVLVTSPPGVRAYAGVPLVGRDGLPLGALCVMDTHPRAFGEEQLRLLGQLARQVVALLEQDRRDRNSGLFDPHVLAQARDPRRLRRALDAGELVPHYQPLVRLRTGVPYALESLLRWEHPQLGTLSPAAFLPAVEDTALVVPLGRAVLDQALAQRAELRRRHAPLDGAVGVNVASGQLARPGLSRDVLAALSRHGLRGEDLALEITESTALPDPDLAHRELTTLVDAGVTVVIDDYGVGWSNLSRVLELPVQALKIDRSIAGPVLTDPAAATMVDATVRMARELGLHVVAEGVETEPVRQRLAQAGCQGGQGWLFSAAVPAAGLLARLLQMQAGAQPLAVAS